jgi:hypothetical protein
MDFESYSQFEAAMHDLLRRRLHAQGRPYQARAQIGGVDQTVAQGPGTFTYAYAEADGWAAQGYEDLPKPTLFEFRYGHPSPDAVPRAMRTADAAKAASVVMVLGTRTSVEVARAILARAEEWAGKIKFVLWTLDDVTRMIKPVSVEESRDAVVVVSTPASGGIPTGCSDVVVVSGPESGGGIPHLADRVAPLARDSAPPPAWRTTRNAYLAELKEAWLRSSLVLFLGAGVSIDAGVPGWNALLHELLLSLIGRQTDSSVQFSTEEIELLADALARQRGWAPAVVARYIRAGLKDEFDAEVRRSLYRRIAADSSSPVLKAIARLCVPRRDGSGVRAVVTYNFDDLLERHLEQSGVMYRAAYREGDLAADDELGIFHVHGFLPAGVQNEKLTESLLVFSEEGYHEVYREPYSWSNLVQMNFLRERVCLLIGLSATDPNLRRLAELAARRRPQARHYILLKREGFPDPAVRSTRLEQAFQSMHHDLQERALRELGLNVLWLEDYAEIPSLLDSLRKPAQVVK